MRSRVRRGRCGSTDARVAVLALVVSVTDSDLALHTPNCIDRSRFGEPSDPRNSRDRSKDFACP